MQRILRLALLLASSMSALEAKRFANYGFYSPYPPPPNQVIYDFAPVRVDGVDYSGHRSTRDSTWRDEFGALLDGDREPTCEQLREMWHYAKSLQRRAARSRQDPESGQASSHLPPFVAFSPLEDAETGEGGAASPGAREPRPEQKAKPPAPPRQANRRRMSTPPITPGRPRPRPRPPAAAKGEAKPVYGVVKTHAPSKATMHVRDPAKEIYSLLQEKALSAGGADGVYGQVKTHADPTRRPSYMSILEKELYGAREEEDADGDRDSFGSVKYELPSGAENEIPTTSSFEKVRAILAAEREAGDGEAYEGEGPFDLIRERLMNTPLSSSSASSKLGSKDNRAIRRKGSRKAKQRKVCSYLKLILILWHKT